MFPVGREKKRAQQIEKVPTRMLVEFVDFSAHIHR